MKPKFFLIIPMLFLYIQAAVADSPEIVAPSNPMSAERVFQYYYFDPVVFYQGDVSIMLTLEVGVNKDSVSQIRLFRPDDLGLLYDDGTHGDRIAGDGIYTLNNIPNNSDWCHLYYGGTHSAFALYKIAIDKIDGGTEEQWVNTGIVKEDITFPATQLGEGLYATEYAFFIVDSKGEALGTPNWPLGDVKCGKVYFDVFKKLYSVLPDVFDFVIIMPGHAIFDPDRNYAENTPYFIRAKNEIQNIGLPISDDTDKFYSDGRLMGMIYHSWGDGQILDHEFGHGWGATLGQSLNLSNCSECFGIHWNPYSDIGGQMCSYVFHPDLPLPGFFVDNGDGTWRIERPPDNNEPYSALDLYAMGLIPPAEVPPVHLLIDPNMTDHTRVTADSVITYTIEDIIAAEGGARVPAYESSPKEFNVAFVVVKNKDFTKAEFAYYSMISKYFASKEQGDRCLTTFYQATGGRGSLNPKLPVFIDVKTSENIISTFTLNQNYPNPFNPATTITYSLNRPTTVSLKIYKCTGTGNKDAD